MIFRSPYPDVATPDIAVTPFVLRHAERLADKPALIDGSTGRTLTYGDVRRRRSPDGGGADGAGLPEG